MSALERPATAVPRHAGLVGSHPLLSYFVLAFAISWGAILVESLLKRTQPARPLLRFADVQPLTQLINEDGIYTSMRRTINECG
jgi:hypothetical protein